MTDEGGVPRKMLRITGHLAEEECNGALREAGLSTKGEAEGVDPILYNRVTFDTITKSDQFRLTLVWEITF